MCSNNHYRENVSQMETLRVKGTLPQPPDCQIYCTYNVGAIYLTVGSNVIYCLCLIQMIYCRVSSVPHHGSAQNQQQKHTNHDSVRY